MAALEEYHRKRDPARTAEPMGTATPSTGGSSFVIQEHHASALHWDFRLERDGVLASWAIPKGIPNDPRQNRLAVQVEDHPLEYGGFEGRIGSGQYGGGTVTIWDSGTYETQKWTDREVMVVLHGQRAQGRFVLFRTGGSNWMIHRMDGPARPDWLALPAGLTPMLAGPGPLPTEDGWAFEMRWSGVRALVRVDGGRIELTGPDGQKVAVANPQLRGLGEQLGSIQALLDGVLADFDPVVFLAFDLLHLDGRALLELPYSRRREQLEALELSGPAWQTPPAFVGGGESAVAASIQQGLGGVIAKRLESPYRPGQVSPDWLAVDPA